MNKGIDMKNFSKEEVLNSTLEYFDNDTLASDVWMKKYCLRDLANNHYELNPDYMHHRLANEFYKINKSYPNSMSYSEIYELFKGFKKLVPQGSPMSAIGNKFQIQSISNCFVIDGPEDSYGGIMYTDQQQAQIMKRRGGVGFDISKLRPKGLICRNAARTTTGIASWLERFSNTTREVGQDGRRGALMLTIDIRHPQIKDFITIKSDLEKVTGANISIRINDEFMNSVNEDKEFKLQWPIDSDDPEVVEMVKAKDIWSLLVDNNWLSAEPGILYWDTVKRMTPSEVYPRYRAVSTNPCVTGDTLIAIADGTDKNYTMKELAESGKDVPVYCCDDKGKIAISMMRRPRLTKENAEIYKVTLDDGSTFRVTGNHKFRLSDGTGTYKRTDRMEIGESLWVGSKYKNTLISEYGTKTSNKNHYVILKSSKGRNSEHRLIYEYYNGKIPNGNVIHHIDHNSQNNRIENLQSMTSEAHRKYHGDLIKGDNNPMVRAHKEWSEEKWEKYRVNLSNACKGVKNGNSCGLTNEELLQSVAGWIKEIGYIPTNNEYIKQGYPNLGNSDSFRSREFGNLGNLIERTAKIVKVNIRRESPNSSIPEKMLQYYRSKTELPLSIGSNGNIYVGKICENCNKEYKTTVDKRESGFCGTSCSNIYVNKTTDTNKRRTETINNTYRAKGEKNKLKHLEVYTLLKFRLKREPKFKEWDMYCKKNNIARRLGTKYGFKDWYELKAAGNDFNHRVVSIEKVGYEDVYTGTVDKYHNYCTLFAQDNEFLLINNQNCGEIVLGPYDSCRLMFLNVHSFVKNPFLDNSEFDYDHFEEIAYKGQRLMDDMIDIEVSHIQQIIEKVKSDPEKDEIKNIEINLWNNVIQIAKDGRRTGLGVTAIGDTLAELGITFGSEEAIETVESIYRTLCLSSYKASIDLAQERGHFKDWSFDIDMKSPYLRKIYDNLPKMYQRKWKKFGRRNVANLTTAPVGSGSIECQTTNGGEPAYNLEYWRNRKINPEDIEKGTKVDFVDQNGDSWQRYKVYHHGVKRWMKITGKTDLKESPYWDSTANKIDWINRVKMQAAAQRWVCHSISSTVNLPNDVTKETISDIYMEAWKSGCKGITVYRDGCRTGVLVNDENIKNKDKFTNHHAPKRPEIIDCDIYHTIIKDEKWTLFIGLMEGKPYEILGGRAENIHLPKKYNKAKIQKRHFKTVHSKYDLVIGENDDQMIIKDIVNVFDNPNHALQTRLISLNMRHGVPIQYLAQQLQKDKEADMFSFSKVISRCLKRYIEDGTKASNKECPECGAEDSLIYEAGCVSCSACGSSKCG